LVVEHDGNAADRRMLLGDSACQTDRYGLGMDAQDPPPVLSDDDALSLWVGRVARAHTHLEYGVDNVHRFLSRQVGDVPASKAVKGLDQLIGECRRLLRRSGADREVLTSGDIALLAARDATGMRNRVLHDMWLPDDLRDDWEPPRWNAFRRSGDLQLSYNSASVHDLDMVIDTHTLLARTRLRVSGLFMALHATWPTAGSRARGVGPGESMPRYIALMTDRFTLEANGDFEIP
jgi:hypothetical protein